MSETLVFSSTASRADGSASAFLCTCREGAGDVAWVRVAGGLDMPACATARADVALGAASGAAGCG